MSERTEAKRATAVAVPRILSQHKAIIGLLYIAGYVLLDWISLIEPYAPFGISPWNPGTGLSFALVLLFGRRMIPFLFVGVLLSDLVHRPLPLPWPAERSAALLIAGGAALLGGRRDRHHRGHAVHAARADAPAHAAGLVRDGAAARRHHGRAGARARLLRRAPAPAVLRHVSADRLDGGALRIGGRHGRHPGHPARPDRRVHPVS